MRPEEREPTLERNLSRAEWMRGAGAIVMRELIGGSFDATPELSESEILGVKQSSKTMGYVHIDEGLTELWTTAYLVADLGTQKAFEIVKSNLSESINRDRYDVIEKNFYEHTFYGNHKQSIREIEKTVSHFPISLVRSICSHAETRNMEDVRFKPRTLNNISDLLESDDVRLMIDQSLFAANGFWQGFSTNINNLATTGFVDSPYAFRDGQVLFTDKALNRLKSTVRATNAPKDMQSYGDAGPRRVASSTSGCPARHTKPSGVDIHSQEVQELSVIFHKSPAELIEEQRQNVAQLGVEYVARCLRKVSDSFKVESETEKERWERVRRYSFLRAQEFDMS